MTSAVAEEILNEVDVEGIKSVADGTGIDAVSVLLKLARGESVLTLESVSSYLYSFFHGTVGQFMNVFLSFAVPCVVSGFAKSCTEKYAKYACMLCACASVVGFAAYALDMMKSVENLLTWLNNTVSAIFPILTALGIATASASMLTSISNIAGKIIVELFSKWGIRLCGFAAAIACGEAMSGSKWLNGIFSLIKSITMWGAGTLVAMFVAVLSIQGMLAAGRDSIALKTAKIAADSIVPVVGGDIADSMSAAAASAALVKSVTGVTGLIIISAGCMKTLIKLISTLFAARFACALTIDISDNAVFSTVKGLGDSVRMLIVICAGAMLISLVLVGSAVRAGTAYMI